MASTSESSETARKPSTAGVNVQQAQQMNDSWITAGQWATLDAARQLRPKPMRALPVILSVVLVFVVLGTLGFYFFEGASGGLVIGAVAALTAVLRWPGRSVRAWRTRFNGKAAAESRMIATLPGTAQSPTLQYEMVRPRPAWERLRIDLPSVAELSIRPGDPPIGAPAFDQVLGLRAPQMTRALLGGRLRTQLPIWHAESKLVVAEGMVVLHIGAEGYAVPSSQIDEICESFQAFDQRMSAPPMAGLTTLARDLTYPFDAARALAMLVGWSTQAETVAASLAGDPVGAALARVAMTGGGLMDPALDGATRSAVGRGVLGAEGPAQAALLAWIRDRKPTDDAGAMLLVELCEAAHAVTEDIAFEVQAVDAESWLVEHGDLPVLAWMRGRGHMAHTARSLKTLSARLQAERGGLLSLDAAQGNLMGGLSASSPAPAPACQPDQTATDC